MTFAAFFPNFNSALMELQPFMQIRSENSFLPKIYADFAQLYLKNRWTDYLEILNINRTIQVQLLLKTATLYLALTRLSS